MVSVRWRVGEGGDEGGEVEISIDIEYEMSRREDGRIGGVQDFGQGLNTLRKKNQEREMN